MKGMQALLAETRQRASRIDHYVDLIPARFYIGSENQQVHASRQGLDPARAKTTSQLVMDAAAAEITASRPGGNAAGSSAGSWKKPPASANSGEAWPRPVAGKAAGSRTELHDKLERRIVELREERRRRQSANDKAKSVKLKAGGLKADAAVTGKTDAKANGKTDAKAKGKANAKTDSHNDAKANSKANAKTDGKKDNNEAKSRKRPRDLDDADVPEAGRLSFEPKVSDLPFNATVGQRGRKVKKMRNDLRRHEVETAKIRQAEARGASNAEDMRKDFAMRKALARARGEKVHDDAMRLRKAQKSLELKKKKGKDKWTAKVDGDKQRVEEQQTQRKENLSKRGSKKKTKAITRSGFEGKRSGYMNSEK